MVLGSGGARGAPLIVQVERGKAADSKGRQAIPQSVHARLGIFCIQLRGINVVIKVHRQRRASVPCAVEIDQPISPGHAGDAVVQPCGMRGRGGRAHAWLRYLWICWRALRWHDWGTSLNAVVNI